MILELWVMWLTQYCYIVRVWQHRPTQMTLSIMVELNTLILDIISLQIQWHKRKWHCNIYLRVTWRQTPSLYLGMYLRIMLGNQDCIDFNLYICDHTIFFVAYTLMIIIFMKHLFPLYFKKSVKKRRLMSLRWL